MPPASQSHGRAAEERRRFVSNRPVSPLPCALGNRRSGAPAPCSEGARYPRKDCSRASHNQDQRNQIGDDTRPDTTRVHCARSGGAFATGSRRLFRTRASYGTVKDHAPSEDLGALTRTPSGVRLTERRHTSESGTVYATSGSFGQAPDYALPVRPILLASAAAYVLLAVGTRVADALGVGGRLQCACRESCWCKRPSLTVFRWVTPGSWHDLTCFDAIDEAA